MNNREVFTFLLIAALFGCQYIAGRRRRRADLAAHLERCDIRQVAEDAAAEAAACAAVIDKIPNFRA